MKILVVDDEKDIQPLFQQQLDLGADDFLTKPIDFISLKEKIKTFV